MKLLILLIFLSACAPREDGTHHKKLSIASEFKDVFDKFQTEASAYGIKADDLVIVFGEPSDFEGCTYTGLATLGCCSRHIGTTPKIIIYRPYWEIAPDYRREAILFHEMGHCVLGRQHLEVKEFDEPVSIMYHNVNEIQGPYYINHRDGYVKELLTK